MIEAEEEKRKAVFKGKLTSTVDFGAKLMSAATQQGAEEDFSWDDEIESETASDAPISPSHTLKAPATPLASEATTPKASSGEKLPNQPTVAVPAAAAAAAATVAPVVATAGKSSNSTSTSPRDSEESYDLVSDQKKSAAQTEDDDSDWE